MCAWAARPTRPVAGWDAPTRYAIRAVTSKLDGYEEARAVYVRCGREIEAARCAMHRANVLFALGRSQEALADREEARAAFARAAAAS